LPPAFPWNPFHPLRKEGTVKPTSLLLVSLFALSVLGCACLSTTERIDTTSLESREEYINHHPEGQYNDCIRNGEITKGMNIYEVIASWGLPNVYLVSRKEPTEHWIYYIEDNDTRSVMVYTLAFRDDMLAEWDIDMKRFIDQRIVDTSDLTRERARRAVPASKRK